MHNFQLKIVMLLSESKIGIIVGKSIIVTTHKSLHNYYKKWKAKS